MDRFIFFSTDRILDTHRITVKKMCRNSQNMCFFSFINLMEFSRCPSSLDNDQLFFILQEASKYCYLISKNNQIDDFVFSRNRS